MVSGRLLGYHGQSPGFNSWHPEAGRVINLAKNEIHTDYFANKK